MNISVNIVSLILVLGAVQGEFFALLLSGHRQGNRLANKVLAFHILLFSLNIFVPEAVHLFPEELPHLMAAAFPLMFLFGPSLYFYALLLTKRETGFRRVHLFHLIPFLCSLAYMIPFYVQPAAVKLELMTRIAQGALPLDWAVGWGAECVHVLAYLLVTYRLLRHHDKAVKENYSSIAVLNLQWLRYLVLGNTVVWGWYVAMFVYAILVPVYDMYGPAYYVFGYASSFFVYAMGYKAWKQPEIFAGEAEIPAEKDPANKYERSGLQADKAGLYLQTLGQYMETEAPYKNPEITLRDLAERLEIPPNHLSQVINEKLGQNFFDFINSYRVAAAKQWLRNPDKQQYTILEIAYEVGFNSKSTFNAAFKKHVQMTPTAYRQQELALS